MPPRDPAHDPLHARLAAAPPVPAPILTVLSRLHEAGHAAYLAGGCVRDLLLGRAPGDFDVATSARPEAVISLFSRVIPTGLQHGTVTVVLPGTPPSPVEVTTFRGEGPYVDGRRPEHVRFLDDVEQDLARRDFTINAMAWDPLRADLRDPFGGATDLARQVVRAVGDPIARLSEDGLRSLRAVRFASVLGFELDPATRAAIPPTLETFRKVALERVRDEFVKLLVGSPKPSRGLALLADTGLLAAFAPELSAVPAAIVDETPARLVVRLAALLHLVGPDTAARRLERLRLPRKVIDDTVHLVREQFRPPAPDADDGTLRRALARVGPEALEDLLALRTAIVRGEGVNVDEALAGLAALRTRFETELARGSPLAVKDLAIRGEDVIATLGGRAGPQVGETLRALLEHVLERPEDNTRERLLALVRARATDSAR